MRENPYPEKIIDEVSGVETPNDLHIAWDEGFAEGYKTAIFDVVSSIKKMMSSALIILDSIGTSDKIKQCLSTLLKREGK